MINGTIVIARAYSQTRKRIPPLTEIPSRVGPLAQQITTSPSGTVAVPSIAFKVGNRSTSLLIPSMPKLNHKGCMLQSIGLITRVDPESSVLDRKERYLPGLGGGLTPHECTRPEPSRGLSVPCVLSGRIHGNGKVVFCAHGVSAKCHSSKWDHRPVACQPVYGKSGTTPPKRYVFACRLSFWSLILRLGISFASN